MAIRQLVEGMKFGSPKISFVTAGRSKSPNLFLRSLNESKGKVVLDNSFNFEDKDGEYTVPHGNRDWNLYENAYRKIGIVANAFDNTANFAIQSGYELEGSEADKKRVKKWIEENNLNLIVLNIMKQMQIYGNAYLEISDSTPKILPVKNMYVVVRKGSQNDGEIIGYRQKIKLGNQTIAFKPNEVIHFKWREIGSEFYGFSDVEPNIGTLTALLNFQEDIGEIMHNYAHPIIHYKLGTPEMPATTEQIDEFKALRDELETGEDLITSQNVEHDIILANLKLIQIDGLIKHMENQLIAGLQVPEIFVRGGQSSNKATASVEIQAFDRRVKAIRNIVGEKLHDEIFVPHLGADVKISWNEMSVESEEIKSTMMMNLVNSGVPTKVALQMTGWGAWVDEYEQNKDDAMPKMNPFEKPKEDDYKDQKEWLEAVEKWKNKYK